MRVIFLQNIKKLGQKDEVKDVNEGYARNFLIPNKLVTEATPKALGELKKRLDQKASKYNKNNKDFNEAVEKMESLVLTIKKKANEEGHLFSGVTIKEIISKLHEKGINLNENHFELITPIKTIGMIQLAIKNTPIELKVKIEKE